LFRKKALDKVLRRQFVVTMTDGGVFQGALLEHDAEVFVFAMVKVRQENGQYVPAADGALYLDRVKVNYMQKVSVTDAPQ
jgi:hypothetical protein